MRCLGAGTELTPPASGHGGGSLRLALDTEADHSASLWIRRRITPPRSGYGGGSLRLALDTEADHSASLWIRRRITPPRSGYGGGSLRLLAGQDHEDVLQRRGAANRVIGHGAVRGVLRA